MKFAFIAKHRSIWPVACLRLGRRIRPKFQSKKATSSPVFPRFHPECSRFSRNLAS